MTSKHVIGQKIVKIHRVRVKGSDGDIHNTVRSIELENGVRLIPVCVMTEDAPEGDLLSTADGKELAQRSIKAREKPRKDLTCSRRPADERQIPTAADSPARSGGDAEETNQALGECTDARLHV